MDFKPPLVKRKMPPLSGLSAFLGQVRACPPTQMPAASGRSPPCSPSPPPSFPLPQFEITEPPVRIMEETPFGRKARVAAEKALAHTELLREKILACAWPPSPLPCFPARARMMFRSFLSVSPLRHPDKPKENKEATPDAMKTLFIGRLSFETSEEKLKAELSDFGTITHVRGPHPARAP